MSKEYPAYDEGMIEPTATLGQCVFLIIVLVIPVIVGLVYHCN